MPYASQKQRGYLHAKHPKIAATWDAEERAAKSGMSKAGHGKLRKLGEELVNQLPGAKQVEEKRERKRRGRVHKMALARLDVPGYNAAVAQQTFDLIMKMDDAEAEMFAEMVVGELYEADVEQNLGALQRHLNEVIDKRIAILKSATMAAVSKGNSDGALSYAAALDQLEGVSNSKSGFSKISAADFRETDFRRDPTSGRFQVKVKHTQPKPFADKAAAGMGLIPTDAASKAKYRRLSSAQKAQYQDEYSQLSRFLSTVTASSAGGDHNVFLRLRDRQGNEYRQHLPGGAPGANQHLLDPNLSLVAVEASPNTLTAGGAAFSLAGALGAGPNAIGATDRALGGLHDFEQDWTSDTDAKASNAQLYQRVGAAGAFLGAVAPTPKTQAAAQVAQIIGRYGPEAESVIGPTARKSAYRYRGTEKTPDAHIVALYGRAINAAKANTPQAEEIEIGRPRGGGKPAPEAREGAKQRETAASARRGSRVSPIARVTEAPAVMQMAAARQVNEHRAPSWAERAHGRRVIQDQLRTTLPTRELYSLQLNSGHIPPSQGVLLNADGQIVTQAIGYGDDHYLPFNLKNLKSLKGGEYIRTRSVGGLTAEDVYTGLISGARRVTVVSRSGTFSIEFDQDFRGGRRYNDKAMRMTRRYEQLLDAVQSKQVSREAVPEPVLQAIKAQVAEEYPGERATALKPKIKERVEEYRSDPDMSPDDEKIMRLVYEQGLRDNPSRDEKEWLSQARQTVLRGKQYNYSLNAQGYEAAQDALQEQFPYYIKSIPHIKNESEAVSIERDKGYVEPGRNRPTEAQAGLFGTTTNASAGKFSASQADYQRGRNGRAGGDLRPVSSRPVSRPTESAADAPVVAPAGAAATPEAAVQQAIAAGRQADAAVELWHALRNDPVVGPAYAGLPQLGQDEAAFTTAMSDPDARELFRTAVNRQFGARAHLLGADTQPAFARFQHSTGAVGSQAYDQANSFNWTPAPMTFDEPGYGPDATVTAKAIARDKIDARTRSLTTGLPLSQLSDKQLHNELSALRDVRSAVRANPALSDATNVDARRALARSLFGQYDPHAIGLIVGPDGIQPRVDDIHRMRALNHGVPDNARGEVATRVSVLPDELTSTSMNARHVAQLQERLAALKRHRTGMDWKEESPADNSIQDISALLENYDNGESISAADVDAVLDSTSELASTAPSNDEAYQAYLRANPGIRST